MHIPKWAWYIVFAVAAYIVYTRFVAVKIKARKVGP